MTSLAAEGTSSDNSSVFKTFFCAVVHEVVDTEALGDADENMPHTGLAGEDEQLKLTLKRRWIGWSMRNCLLLT